MKGLAILALCLCAMSPALAQEDTFTELPDGAKVHQASGYSCPLKIGRFERDAVGVRSTENDTDYCAYSARDGIYGTIVLRPLPSEYDPKALLSQDFVVMEGAGSRQIGETTETFGPDKQFTAFTRTYENARVEAMHYRVEFTCAAVGSWVVMTTTEYAEPRDVETKNAFLKAVFDKAAKELAAQN